MDNLAWGYPQIRMVHTHLALFLTSVLLLLHQQRAAAVAAAAPAQVSHSLSPAEPHSHGSRCCTTVGRCWLAACGTTFVNQEASKGHCQLLCPVPRFVEVQSSGPITEAFGFTRRRGCRA